MDLEMLEMNLETEQAIDKLASIRDKIEKTKEEITDLESTTVTEPLNTTLLSGLQNRISDIEFFLKTEKNTTKREELETSRINCIKALSDRQKPVTNAAELNDAVDQIESDQRLINSLSNGKIDEVDLYLFMDSDMLQFVDSKLERELKDASIQMTTNDNTQYALGRTKEKLFEDADSKWLESKKSTEQDIRNFEKEKTEINAEIPEASISKREQLRRRLKEIDRLIPKYQDQIKEGRSDWTHGQRKLEEKKDASRPVTDNVDPNTLEKLQTLIIESQGIRAEKVQEYLAGEFRKLEEQLAEAKKGDVFSGKTLMSLEDKFAEAKSLLIDQKQTDPKLLRRLTDNFQNAKAHLSTSVEEIQEVKENRPQIEAQVTSDYAKLQQALTNLSPDKIQEVLKKYRQELADQKIPEDSAIFRKAMTALNQLSDPNSDIHAKLKEFSQRLENISEIDAEELLAISRDFEVIKPQLEFLENFDANLAEAISPENQDAKLAHKTIKELGQAQNPDDIRKILETNLGTEHLQFVSHAEFEKEHRDVTEKGHMIFEKEGDKWKIIIDESVFKEAKSLEILKTQLTHELLHVEFEKSDRVKTQVREALKEADPEKWEEIRAAYVEKANSEGKIAPDGQKWKDDGSHDDYILSELYAMQNEMGRVWSEGKSLTDKLNNLLVGAGVAASIGDIAEKTRAYEEGAKKEKFGYAGGIDESEDIQPASSSISTTESMSKGEATYHSNHEKIEKIRKRLDELSKSEYLGLIPGASQLRDAMEDYNESTDGLNEDFKKNPESEIFAIEIDNRINKVSSDLTNVEDKIGKAARNAPNNEINLLQKLWINTTFLSIEDFVQVGTHAFEFFQRRHKRKVEDHAAKLGMALFSGTDLGREARARQQKAEAEEVSEWQDRYKTLDAWELMDEMKGIANSPAPNSDQLKAILRILGEKGRLDWRNEDLWIALNKLQSTTELKPGDQLLLHNPILLRQRLRTALGEIYDYDEFETLERSNEGAYQSEKGKYDTRHSRMQDQLDPLLDEMLSQHRAGEQVDPILYESIMEYAIKNGKSYAENVMFHLISGMAEGLLAPDRGLALGDHLNIWPAIDWFSSMTPPMSQADWRRLCMEQFPKDFMNASISEDGFGNEFKNFYWTAIQNSDKVIERVKKSVGERSWDHDWGRSIAPLGDSRTAKQFLSGRSGQQETKITGVGNAYAGAVMWLEENSRNPQYASKENFARMAGWIAMSEGILDGSAFMDKSKDINTRADESMNNSVPRESAVGRHKGKTVREHREIASDFLMKLDPQFFTMIKGREAREDKTKKEMGENARDYLMQKYPSIANDLADVEDIDQIYTRIDLIIGAMFDKLSDAEFQAILDETAP